jgi:hypothetical protein
LSVVYIAERKLMKLRLAAAAASLAAGLMVVAPAPASAAPALQFGTIQYDPPGSDTRTTNAKLNAEYVNVRNVTKRAVQLKGVTVRDAQNHVYRFPAVSLGAGKTVRLHTGRGTNTTTDVYWGQGNYVWNNGGDTARLRTAAGTVIDTCKWSSTGTGKIACP